MHIVSNEINILPEKLLEATICTQYLTVRALTGQTTVFYYQNSGFKILLQVMIIISCFSHHIVFFIIPTFISYLHLVPVNEQENNCSFILLVIYLE